ncbi:hypothetical protein JCM9492_13680 [Aquifex pyrophilus]
MGYEPNLLPSCRWFAGRVFLEKAKRILDKYTDGFQYEPEEGLKILSEIFSARLQVIRGIRTVLELPAEKNCSLEELVREIKGKISEEKFEELYNTYFQEFEVRYYGSCQYVPDYEFFYKGKNYRFLNKPKELHKLIDKAIKERLQNLEKLLNIAIEVFFQVYIEDKKDEIFYYSFAEVYDDYEVYEVLVKNGIVTSIEEAIEKFGEDTYEIEARFPELFEKEILEIYKMQHYDKFWEWEEADSIYYNHGN